MGAAGTNFRKSGEIRAGTHFASSDVKRMRWQIVLRSDQGNLEIGGALRSEPDCPCVSRKGLSRYSSALWHGNIGFSPNSA
jgi:hypothetical protein